jgi:hypothetical protein
MSKETIKALIDLCIYVGMNKYEIREYFKLIGVVK